MVLRHFLVAALALGLNLGAAGQSSRAADFGVAGAVVQPVQFYGRGFGGGPGYGYYGPRFYGPRFYRPGFYGRPFYGPGYYGRGFYGRGYAYGPGYYGRRFY